MSVTIDQEELPAEHMGLATVGQVLSHLKSRNRLVVNLQIDGQSPDLDAMDVVRAQPLKDRSVRIETTEPARMVADVCRDVNVLLDEAETSRLTAIELLQKGSHVDAFRQLGVCFNSWSNSRQSVLQLARLLKLDLDKLQLEDRLLSQFLNEFTQQLTDIRTALEARDFVHLTDILSYEADQVNKHWRSALDTISNVTRQ
jgi:hypothetical protein